LKILVAGFDRVLPHPLKASLERRPEEAAVEAQRADCSWSQHWS